MNLDAIRKNTEVLCGICARNGIRKAVEAAIGRKLDIISGGSSINLLLLADGKNQMPARINHLRLGGSIANPINMRLTRNITFDGMREDSIKITGDTITFNARYSAILYAFMGQHVSVCYTHDQ